MIMIYKIIVIVIMIIFSNVSPSVPGSAESPLPGKKKITTFLFYRMLVFPQQFSASLV